MTSSWFYYLPDLTMHGHSNIKLVWNLFLILVSDMCLIYFVFLSPVRINYVISEGHVVLCFFQTPLISILSFELPYDVFKSEVSEQCWEPLLVSNHAELGMRVRSTRICIHGIVHSVPLHTWKKTSSSDRCNMYFNYYCLGTLYQ